MQSKRVGGGGYRQTIAEILAQKKIEEEKKAQIDARAGEWLNVPLSERAEEILKAKKPFEFQVDRALVNEDEVVAAKNAATKFLNDRPILNPGIFAVMKVDDVIKKALRGCYAGYRNYLEAKHVPDARVNENLNGLRNYLEALYSLNSSSFSDEYDFFLHFKKGGLPRGEVAKIPESLRNPEEALLDVLGVELASELLLERNNLLSAVVANEEKCKGYSRYKKHLDCNNEMLDALALRIARAHPTISEKVIDELYFEGVATILNEERKQFRQIEERTAASLEVARRKTLQRQSSEELDAIVGVFPELEMDRKILGRYTAEVCSRNNPFSLGGSSNSRGSSAPIPIVRSSGRIY